MLMAYFFGVRATDAAFCVGWEKCAASRRRKDNGTWGRGAGDRCMRGSVLIACAVFELQDKIKEALNHGVIKFNIDTDIQVHLPTSTRLP
jgi:hypothetical protein